MPTRVIGQTKPLSTAKKVIIALCSISALLAVVVVLVGSTIGLPVKVEEYTGDTSTIGSIWPSGGRGKYFVPMETCVGATVLPNAVHNIRTNRLEVRRPIIDCVDVESQITKIYAFSSHLPNWMFSFSGNTMLEVDGEWIDGSLFD